MRGSFLFRINSRPVPTQHYKFRLIVPQMNNCLLLLHSRDLRSSQHLRIFFFHFNFQVWPTSSFSVYLYNLPYKFLLSIFFSLSGRSRLLASCFFSTATYISSICFPIIFLGLRIEATALIPRYGYARKYYPVAVSTYYYLTHAVNGQSRISRHLPWNGNGGYTGSTIIPTELARKGSSKPQKKFYEVIAMPMILDCQRSTDTLRRQSNSNNE